MWESIDLQEVRAFPMVATELHFGKVPLDALAVELGSNRNAIYKTMFEARRKLRARLAANEFMDDDMLRPP